MSQGQSSAERPLGTAFDPFPPSLDSRIFYRSRQHAQAESVLEYALESSASIALLTGEIGAGKSLLIQRLMSKLGDGVRVGLIDHIHGQTQSIYVLAASALGVQVAGQSDFAIYGSLINAVEESFGQGRHTLLIVDEAQKLSDENLEDLRLLSNANSGTRPLHIMLVGQPELRARLNQPGQLQLAQRVSAQYHLGALASDETYAYIRHRLQAAGGNPSLFTPEAANVIHARTGGIPRLISQLCQFAMAQAIAFKRTRIDAELLNQIEGSCWGSLALPGSAEERFSSKAKAGALLAGLRGHARPAAAAAGVVALVAGGWFYWHSVPWAFGRTGSSGAAGPGVALARTTGGTSGTEVGLAPAALPVTASAPPPAARVTVPVERHEAATVSPAPVAAPHASAGRTAWFVRHAAERLNAGDTAGAERLIQRASSEGVSATDLAELREAIEAQQLEVRLSAAGEAVRAAIASGNLLGEGEDSAEARYQAMARISPRDPLTLRARRELREALIARAGERIHANELEPARRYLSAMGRIGGPADATEPKDVAVADIKPSSAAVVP